MRGWRAKNYFTQTPLYPELWMGISTCQLNALSRWDRQKRGCREAAIAASERGMEVWTSLLWCCGYRFWDCWHVGMLDHCYLSRSLSPKVYRMASGGPSILTGIEVAALLEVQLSSVFWGFTQPIILMTTSWFKSLSP